MVHEEVHIKKKLISGVLTLATRNFLLNFFSFAANLILTILLTPSIFGIFFLVSAIISFLNYFSDIGLAAALIQKKEEPTDQELSSVFTIQEGLVLLIMAVMLTLSSQITHFYKLGVEGTFLLYALLFSFFLSSLKTIPSILLERKLEFGLLSIPGVVENIAYYLVTVVLAYLNFGIYSFAWGAVTRSVVGLIAIYLIRPWTPTLNLSFLGLRHLLSFGIPFQINSMLALVKDDLLTLFLGKMIPLAHIGYLGWAKKWAETPLRIIMDSVIRVTFPAFARLQDNKELLRRVLEKTIFFLALFILPTTAFLLFFIKPLIYIIPKYIKWEPAIFSFYLFSIASVMAAFSSPIVNALNSLGKIKTTLLLMIMWTILTWTLVPYSAFIWGFNGVAVAYALISITSVVPLILMRRLLYFNIMGGIYKPLLVTVITFIPAYFLLNDTDNFFILIMAILLVIFCFTLLTIFWMKREILAFIPSQFKFITQWLKEK